MASSSNSQLNQHKRLAMGQSVGFKKGGSVQQDKKGGAIMGGPKVGVGTAGTSQMGKGLKTGMPASPLTVSKQQNGVPGYKKGGKVDMDGDMPPKKGGMPC